MRFKTLLIYIQPHECVSIDQITNLIGIRNHHLCFRRQQSRRGGNAPQAVGAVGFQSILNASWMYLHLTFVRSEPSDQPRKHEVTECEWAECWKVFGVFLGVQTQTLKNSHETLKVAFARLVVNIYFFIYWCIKIHKINHQWHFVDVFLFSVNLHFT